MIGETRIPALAATAMVGVIAAHAAWATPSDTDTTVPIRVATIEVQTPIGPARGWSAVIDLTDPRVDIVVTAAREGDGLEALLTPTDAWAQSERVALAINANFYAAASGEADIIGLSVSDGVVVSPARAHNGIGDPALLFAPDGAARIERCAPCDGAWDAVAGVGGSQTSEHPGALLLEDGVNHGASARVEPKVRHPRTAAGVSADGKTLYLAVVDGRQPGWSVGLTLPELADLMRDLGADDALNLDGGGSSAFVSYVSDTGHMIESPIMNRPSDGRVRPVANHLGIRLVTPPASDAHADGGDASS